MVNPNLPSPALILAGLLSQITFEKILLQSKAEKTLASNIEYFEITWRLQLFCKNPSFGWMELLLLSTFLAIIAVVMTPSGHKFLRGVWTFIGSLILNTSVGCVGFTGIYCLDEHFEYRITLELFQYATTPIFASAAVAIVANYLKRPRTTAVRLQRPSNEAHGHSLRSKLKACSPGSPILLTGVCAQLTFEKLLGILVTSYPTAPDFCALRGMGSWAQLLSLSTFLLVVILCVTSRQHRLSQGTVTFLSTFLLNSSLGHIGGVGAYCGSHYNVHVREMFRYVTIPVSGLAALLFFVVFLKTSYDDLGTAWHLPLSCSACSSAVPSETNLSNNTSVAIL